MLVQVTKLKLLLNSSCDALESKEPSQTLHNDDDDDNGIYSVRLLLIGMTEPQNQIMKPLFK